MSSKSPLFALALLASSAAFAQAPSVPAPVCAKPELPAADKALTEAAAAKINAASKVYADCITSYHNARKAAVDESNAAISRATAVAQANVDAANKAQLELTSFQEALNANIAARNKAFSEANPTGEPAKQSSAQPYRAK